MGIQEIMSLSEAERILLVEQIWDSLDHGQIEVTQAQRTELDSRMQMDAEGKMSWHTWDEAKEILKTK